MRNGQVRHKPADSGTGGIAAAMLVAVASFSTALWSAPQEQPAVVWVEAEQFAEYGGWSNDSQFVDLMGSPYLLATGVGRAVKDATTTIDVPRAGKYRLWVRCKDWLPQYSPGQFQVYVGPDASGVVFGKAPSDKWQWVDGGEFHLEAGPIEIRLHDLTGWWGRCDALVLAAGGFRPSDDPEMLADQRLLFGGVSRKVFDGGSFDVVVVGGGPAGCAAAIAAARHSCRVALVQDRPVLGGNASSEISVPPMGYIGTPPDKVNITGLAEELFPRQDWRNYADSNHILQVVRNEKNISLFLNTRATGVEKSTEDVIVSVIGLNVRSGRRLRFRGKLFIDCTGHGWIGYYSGAEYMMGQESRSQFNESLAPVKAGRHTMGNDLYNARFKRHDKPVAFECPPWAYRWTSPEDFEPVDSHDRLYVVKRPPNFDRPSRGRGRNPGDDINGGVYRTWWVEYGGMLDVIKDAEKIRDELFRINVGLWNYAKNHNPKTIEANRNRELVWLNYVMGVRESRRLVGDYVMTQNDFETPIQPDDIVAFTDWGIDVHHPEGFWVKGNDCIHVYKGRRTGIAYRTLYSKNITNLLMAGRCHSATHIALGGTRVMRPVCMMGQAAGTAAAIAVEHGTTPRGVYKKYIRQLQQALLKDGCYLPGIKNADPEDLGLRSEVTASSHRAGMEPQKVINGWNRIVGKDRNAWAPREGASLPQWVQLRFEQPVFVNRLHVSFEDDEKLDVDFAVEAKTAKGWSRIAEVTGNHLRRRVVNFERVRTESVRVVVTRARGDFAICEIRSYDEAGVSKADAAGGS